MSKLSERIQSLRQVVGKDWVRPPAEKAEQLHEVLYSDSGADALHYLKAERGLTEDTIKHFKLGYDEKKDAVSIPIFKGHDLVNIKYRHLNPKKAKYSGETGAETWIYHEAGIDEGKKKGGVLIVEGEFDLMSCWQNGIKNVISPAAGKNSYGVWLELLDPIRRVYIAYDNDKAGKDESVRLAERTGLEKTFEIKYPDGIKDANEFFKKHDIDEFKGLIKHSAPFYRRQFESAGDILFSFLEEDQPYYEVSLIPNVKIERDWLIVLSGLSGVGKTTATLNIAKELANKGVACLFMPFERGNRSVGGRFLEVFFDKTREEIKKLEKEDVKKMAQSLIDLPVYFTTPPFQEVLDVAIKSKRLFDTKFVIIDHIDYLIRGSDSVRETTTLLKDIKSVAIEHGIVFIVVSHLKKDGSLNGERKPKMEDLKGSSSLYQDPECVVMLSSDESYTIFSEVVKNKGEKGSKKFGINEMTGAINNNPDDW